MVGSLLWMLCFVHEAQLAVTLCEYEFISSEQKTGTFSSPNYPAPYPENINCRYSFKGQDTERVQIVFTDIDLNYPVGDPSDPFDCENMDSLTAKIDDNRDIGVYCGAKQPPMLMSSNNQMEMVFISHDSSNAKGFEAKFNFVTDFGIKSGEQVSNKECQFSFESQTSFNGTFASPNYPGLYPRDTTCHYLFYGNKVDITFPAFDVEGIPPGCSDNTQSDYVEFSNFNVVLPDRKMERICGAAAQRRETSDGDFYRVTFKSNDVYDATGFEAFYQFRREEEHPMIIPMKTNKSSHDRPIIIAISVVYLVANVLL